MAWELLNKVGNVADLASLFFDFKNWSALSKVAGLFAKKKTAEATSGAAPSGPAAAPAAPAPVAESVDTWSTNNNKALAALETMFSIEPAPGPFGGRPLTVSAVQREAFNVFAKLLTSGEGQALENVFALAPGEKGWVKLTWLAPAAAPGGAPLPRRKSYEMWMRPRGVRIYRAIADDILIAPTPTGRLARAKRLVEQMRKLHILDNIGDDMSKGWKWITDKAPVEFGSGATLNTIRQAADRVGWGVVINDILWTPRGLAIRRQIAEAADEAAKEHWHSELRRYIIYVASGIYRATPPKRGLSWSGWVAVIGGLMLLVGLIIVPAIS
ncbi:MAG: hypothetical protein E6P95_00980 [Candidatus Moraniibacteriota bacterium]|nr:MAG: hypothetical protein E6P95_00980 [Candidatus Moranbacteria bacterium]